MKNKIRKRPIWQEKEKKKEHRLKNRPSVSYLVFRTIMDKYPKGSKVSVRELAKTIKASLGAISGALYWMSTGEDSILEVVGKERNMYIYRVVRKQYNRRFHRRPNRETKGKAYGYRTLSKDRSFRYKVEEFRS